VTKKWPEYRIELHPPLGQILPELNKRIAHLYCMEPIVVSVEFVPYIPPWTSQQRDAQILGMCYRNKEHSHIKLLKFRGWRETLVHELVHIYNLGNENHIRRATKDVIKALKFGGDG